MVADPTFRLLWQRIVEALKARGAVPPGTSTEGEIARYARMHLGTPLVERFVHDYYYPHQFGSAEASISEQAAIQWVEEIEALPALVKPSTPFRSLESSPAQALPPSTLPPSEREMDAVSVGEEDDKTPAQRALEARKEAERRRAFELEEREKRRVDTERKAQEEIRQRAEQERLREQQASLNKAQQEELARRQTGQNAKAAVLKEVQVPSRSRNRSVSAFLERMLRNAMGPFVGIAFGVVFMAGFILTMGLIQFFYPNFGPDTFSFKSNYWSFLIFIPFYFIFKIAAEAAYRVDCFLKKLPITVIGILGAGLYSCLAWVIAYAAVNYPGKEGPKTTPATLWLAPLAVILTFSAVTFIARKAKKT